MAQATRFAPIPNTDPMAYMDAMALLLGEIRASTPTPKALREFMRMNNLFDKPTHGTLLEFLDIDTGGPAVTLGQFAFDILDADDQRAIRKLMADRLISLNPLMAKYCLEALDADQGGRLHSTNELY
ncbi:MAG: hypothetical protein GXP54_06035, partial [Deltaproteobacteria bacterium]|nr:hypothetical protein [Deltaproteobacteria bacterium]